MKTAKYIVVFFLTLIGCLALGVVLGAYLTGQSLSVTLATALGAD